MLILNAVGLQIRPSGVFDSMCNVNRFKDVTYGIYVEY